MAAQINADADDVVVVAVAVDDDAADTGNAIVVEAKKVVESGAYGVCHSVLSMDFLVGSGKYFQQFLRYNGL